MLADSEFDIVTLFRLPNLILKAKLGAACLRECEMPSTDNLSYRVNKRELHNSVCLKYCS